MYKNGCVLALIANGQVLEEDNSKRVCMPFGTEYKVRLINKNYERNAADLIVNGENIARFIVGAGETIDIERFLDGNLNSGNRFKFTSLNDSRVKDKNDFDNGIVEVHFYKERKKQEPIIIREEHHHYDHYPVYPDPKPWKPFSPWFGCNGDIVCSFNAGDSGKGLSSGTDNAMNFASCTASRSEVGGATVRGSNSYQQFSEVSGYEFESDATILKLKIINGEPVVGSKYCSGCGRKRKDGDKFCGNCGNKIS